MQTNKLLMMVVFIMSFLSIFMVCAATSAADAYFYAEELDILVEDLSRGEKTNIYQHLNKGKIAFFVVAFPNIASLKYLIHLKDVYDQYNDKGLTVVAASVDYVPKFIMKWIVVKIIVRPEYPMLWLTEKQFEDEIMYKTPEPETDKPAPATLIFINGACEEVIYTEAGNQPIDWNQVENRKMLEMYLERATQNNS